MGLSPILVDEIFRTIIKLNRERGVTILLVEQNAQMALYVSNRAYVMETGEITTSGSARELLHNDEIKKGSRLVIRPGQDAIFMYNGKVEGVFCDEGSFDSESDIIPFLSSLKGFKFGFNTSLAISFFSASSILTRKYEFSDKGVYVIVAFPFILVKATS